MTSFAGGRLCGSAGYEGRGIFPLGGSPLCSRNSGMPGGVLIRAPSLDQTEVFETAPTVHTSRALSRERPVDTLHWFEETPPPSDVSAMEAWIGADHGNYCQ